MLKPFSGDLARLAQSNDAGDILGARPSSGFLPATRDKRDELGATINVKHPDAFRAVELVSAQAKKVNLRSAKLEWDLADRLHSIRVKETAFFPNEICDLVDGKDHAGLVVCPHDRYHGSVRADSPLEFTQVELALGIDTEPCDLVTALGEHLASFQRGAVFDPCGDDVLPVAIHLQSAMQRSVGGLGAAAREKDLAGFTAKQPGDTFAGEIECLGHLLAKTVSARGVAVLFGEEWHHLLDDGRVHPGGRVVVEIDEVAHWTEVFEKGCEVIRAGRPEQRELSVTVAGLPQANRWVRGLGKQCHLATLRRVMIGNHAFVLLVMAVVLPLRAEEIPPITVSRSDKLSIAISGIPPADAKVLQNDLVLSGAFSVVPVDRAQFVVGGLGAVKDRGGKSVLQNTYQGSGRGRLHAFADDIVETLTGAKGFANTKIAFVATKTGKKEIYTCDADGSNVVQLTHDGAISVSPNLSADGRRLLYTGYQSGYADVYQIDIGSGARSRIIKYPGTNSGATFSPDGGRIAVTLSKDGNPELYVVNGMTGAHRLTRTAGVESSPTWSPDGTEIIYSSDDRGGPQLYRISAGGGGRRPISTGHSYCTEPNWSPDGKKVAFNTRGGGFQVTVLDLGAGTTRTLGDGQDPAWGANSRHLIFAEAGALVLQDTITGQRTTLVTGLGRISEPTWSRQ